MKYAKEVDNMCKVNCGASHGCAPDSRRGKMGVLQGNQGYLRIDTRDRLVCSAAGRLQADAQCQGRHYRRGADRDAGLFGHDPFGGNGLGSTGGKNTAGGLEYRSCL